MNDSHMMHMKVAGVVCAVLGLCATGCERGRGAAQETKAAPVASAAPIERRDGGSAAACLAFPDAWLGDWGTADGIGINCGGMTGDCTVTRTRRTVEFTIAAPNLLSGRAVCLSRGRSIFGDAYFIDAWKGDAVRLFGDVLSRSENHPDGFGTTWVRLDGSKTSTLPAWAIGDFEFVDVAGKPTLRTGENGVWVVQGGPLRFTSGTLVKDPTDEACVTLKDAWFGGSLCTRGRALEFAASAPEVGDAGVFRRVRRTPGP